MYAGIMRSGLASGQFEFEWSAAQFAGEPYFPAVVQAVAGDDFAVYTYFSDGSVRQADIRPLIAQGGVFSQLADPALFRDRLTVMNHAVAWDLTGSRDPRVCIDLDPVRMYEGARKVADPLAEAGGR